MSKVNFLEEDEAEAAVSKVVPVSVKKSCKHEPSKVVGFKMAVDRFDNRYYQHVTNCQYCGVELIADWKAK